MVSREVTGHGVKFWLTPDPVAACISRYADELRRHAGSRSRDLSVARPSASKTKDAESGRGPSKASSKAWKTQAEILALCEVEIAKRAKMDSLYSRILDADIASSEVTGVI